MKQAKRQTRFDCDWMRAVEGGETDELGFSRMHSTAAASGCGSCDGSSGWKVQIEGDGRYS